ncbi:MAG TPA: hypothetical protein VF581_11135 [Flavobacterium sp.]|jgi:hypothetical protein
MNDKFVELKKDVQQIIDFIAAKQYHFANEKLADAGDALDEILDFSDDDEDLMEVSRYQVLLNQLQQKIKIATSLN